MVRPSKNPGLALSSANSVPCHTLEASSSAAPSAPAPAKGGRSKKKDWETTRSVKIHTLTEDDIAAGTYSIFDVVMPLPGFEVDLPGGRLRQMFIDILAADGLDASDCWKRQKSVPCPRLSSARSTNQS